MLAVPILYLVSFWHEAHFPLNPWLGRSQQALAERTNAHDRWALLNHTFEDDDQSRAASFYAGQRF